jgi:hypothetical protein
MRRTIFIGDLATIRPEDPAPDIVLTDESAEDVPVLAQDKRSRVAISRSVWEWIVEGPSLQSIWTVTVRRLGWLSNRLSSLWLDLRREEKSNQYQEAMDKFHRCRNLS